MNTTYSANGQRQTATLKLWNINHVGDEVKEEHSKDVLAVNGTRICHET